MREAHLLRNNDTQVPPTHCRFCSTPCNCSSAKWGCINNTVFPRHVTITGPHETLTLFVVFYSYSQRNHLFLDIAKCSQVWLCILNFEHLYRSQPVSYCFGPSTNFQRYNLISPYTPIEFLLIDTQCPMRCIFPSLTMYSIQISTNFK